MFQMCGWLGWGHHDAFTPTIHTSRTPPIFGVEYYLPGAAVDTVNNSICFAGQIALLVKSE